MLLILIGLIFTIIPLSNGYSNTHRDWDICSHWNGRRHFLELGERGELHAHNVSASNYRSTLYTPPPLNVSNKTTNYNTDIWYQCNLELVTCAECVIRITFIYTNFSKICETPINAATNNNNNNHNNPTIPVSSSSSSSSVRCPCEHVLFSEPPYDTTGQDFCGDGKIFRSKTRALLLKFYFRATYSHVFSLQYFSERNVKIISGSPRQSIISNNYTQNIPQIISTPYFPMPYPRDYGVEHILTCESDDCHVRLEFTDFQIGLTSTMEVFDSNGQMIDSYTGEYFRPPIIVSNGKSLLLQFRGNGVTGLGYKAEITFISIKQIHDKATLPFTDCGGMVETLGGAITMMKMLDNETDSKLYDCIWIIKPGNNYMMMKTHLSIRVDAFLKMNSKSELIIREGITSDGIIVETIQWPNNGMTQQTHIVPVLSGFYIRLHGVFGYQSRLAIVYSIFNYMSCYIGSEFLCDNNHCISVRLHCDGFDHCGDGSDEPETCQQEWSHIQNERSWYSHKPNYYFPKIDQYPDLKTATGIFVMSTLGILVVLTGWMMILYRMGVRARHQRELQNHLQTISELLDRQDELPNEDHPPDYEAPPDYEEVIKIGIENEIIANTPRHHRNRRTPRAARPNRSRNRNGSDASDTQSNCNLSIPGPSTSSIVSETRTNYTGGGNNHVNTNNLQDLTAQLPRLEFCEAPGPSTSEGTTSTIRPACTNTQIGSISSESSVSYGSIVPDTTQHPQQSSNYSLGGNSTQFDECSTGFRDESLNISLNLPFPQSSTSTQHQQPNNLNDFKPAAGFLQNKITMYSENSHLKKAWVVFNTGQVHTINKRQRLRHTYSTPETFLHELSLPDFNYGTNIQSNRNSLLSNSSNASTFGSDLLSDPILMSSDQKLIICCDADENDAENKKKNSPKISSIDKNVNVIEEFEKENNVSCFGTVNLFGGGNNTNKNQRNNKQQQQRRKRNVRSKSFNNQCHQKLNENIKRCSSVDLLVVHHTYNMDDLDYGDVGAAAATNNGDDDDDAALQIPSNGYYV